MSTAPATAGRRAQVAVVVTFLVNGLLFASWAAHIPKIKTKLGIDDGVLGLALLGTPIGSVTAMLVCGWALPRVGSRVISQVTLLGYCIAGPFVGLADSVWGLAVALFAWGAFQGSLDVAMNTQAITVEHERDLPLMNGFHAWWSIGAFAGAGAGTLGVALGVELGPQLVALGIPALIAAAVLSVRMLPDAADPVRPEIGTTEIETDAPARRLSGAMLLLGAIALASMLCEGAAADWSSVYLRDALDSNAAVAGLGYTAFTLAMVLVRIAGNRLLRRFALHRLLPTLAAVGTVAMAVTLATGWPALAVVGFFLFGLGLGAVVPSAFSAAGRLPGLHPGASIATVSALGWVGFVCGPPLIGRLAHATSLPTALVVLPLLTAFVTVAAATTHALREPDAKVAI